MEPSGASEKRVSVLEQRAVLCRFRKPDSPPPQTS